MFGIHHDKQCFEFTYHSLSLLFSYDTLVGYRLGEHRYQTASYYSKATNRHLRKAGYAKAPSLPQNALIDMARDALEREVHRVTATESLVS